MKNSLTLLVTSELALLSLFFAYDGILVLAKQRNLNLV